MKTMLDRKVYRSFPKVTLHERFTVAISIKLINHEHKKNKTLVTLETDGYYAYLSI